MALIDRSYGRGGGRAAGEGRVAHYLDRQYEALHEQIATQVAEHLSALDDATLAAHGVDPKTVIHFGGKGN